MITTSNINARQINSAYATRNRQYDYPPIVLIDSASGDMLVDENGFTLIPKDQEGASS